MQDQQIKGKLKKEYRPTRKLRIMLKTELNAKKNSTIGVGAIAAIRKSFYIINPLNPELNPICYLLALLAHRFLHVSRIMVKSLTLRLLMSYIYIYIYIYDISSLRVNKTTAEICSLPRYDFLFPQCTESRSLLSRVY